MNNREWLYSLDVADLADWFDAEHVEHQERALDGDTAALNARINELRAHERELRELCKQLTAERELYREVASQLLDTITDGLNKASAIIDDYDEGMA